MSFLATAANATGAAAKAAANATSTTASKTASAAAAEPTLDSTTYFFDVDVGLLCFAGLFVLLALPRAIARFARLSEWFAGCFFHSVKIQGPPRFTRPFQLDPKAGISSDSSSPDIEKQAGVAITEVSSSQFDDVIDMPSMSMGEPKNPPAYMPAWSSLFPVASSVLSMKIRPGYSVGKAILLLAYLALLMASALIDVNLFTAPARLGYVAVSQLPIIYIMASKNTVFGALIGKGYEKLNYLHRFAGRVAVFCVNAHALAYFAKWSQDGTIASHMETNHKWGCVALGAMDILFLFSLTPVRQTCYQLFFVTHCIAGVVVLVAVVYHEPWAIPYIEIAAALYGFDRLVRLIQTRIVTAHLRPIPELGMTRIEIPSVNAGWRAGQHVRIKVLSTGMGVTGWAESHPFTIASVAKSRGEEGLVLMCKKAGDWTNKLFEVAQRTEYEAESVGRNVKVVLNGPYGGPGHALIHSYSGAVIVTGGSGITYALSTIQELMQKSSEGASRVRHVELVWSVADPSSLWPMLPLFTSLLAEAQSCMTTFRISVHYTRAVTSEDALKPLQRLPAGLSLSAGRPRVTKIIENVVDRVTSFGNGESAMTGIMVGVCGPLALGEEVGRAVRRLDNGRKKAVGGVELHEEIFGW
ncbi:hypothetical protein WOLCODRAFT_140747 [Wolfiporia cocos MD-104 SS10]|uniref:ferric-chelate reductase (NADPH) n=1 Tax=Wolfiporia cocos (strain MD-104) TaxID=742152 RepID=A0A2H3J4H8_WOLCO|nr:hypothetical protein WOLCODRAFT_140747 [Wolfiporia cocos MD-104 SS10]